MAFEKGVLIIGLKRAPVWDLGSESASLQEAKADDVLSIESECLRRSDARISAYTARQRPCMDQNNSNPELNLKPDTSTKIAHSPFPNHCL